MCVDIYVLCTIFPRKIGQFYFNKYFYYNRWCPQRNRLLQLENINIRRGFRFDNIFCQIIYFKIYFIGKNTGKKKINSPMNISLKLNLESQKQIRSQLHRSLFVGIEIGPTLTRGLIIDPLKKLVRFYQTMTETKIKQMQEKINVGILLPESV